MGMGEGREEEDGLGRAQETFSATTLLAPELGSQDLGQGKDAQEQGCHGLGPGDPTGVHGLYRSAAAWEEGLCPWD